MKVSVIVDECERRYNDTDNDTMSASDWLNWYNLAVEALVSIFPRAYTVAKTWQLTASETVQSIPTGDLRLMRLIRNMGSDGATPGEVIRGPLNMEALDGYNQTWTEDTAQTYIEEYFYDPEIPEQFLCWPPVHASTAVYVYGVVSTLPTRATDADTDDIAIPLAYRPDLEEFMMYLAYSPDDENSPNFTRAERHWGHFKELIEAKYQAQALISPRVADNRR